MRNVFASIENILWGRRKECQFDTERDSHLLIFPGMLGPVNRSFPLVKFLKSHQSKYAITAIPLGLSTTHFEFLINESQTTLVENLFSKANVKEIIFFGHSYGGRVVCALVAKLSRSFPQISFSVITAGTPLVEKPKKLSWFRKIFYYTLSPAFREWPQIEQPRAGLVKKYIGYYSDTDKVVDSESAKFGHTGDLRELKNFSHTDFIKAKKMGPILGLLLEKEFAAKEKLVVRQAHHRRGAGGKVTDLNGEERRYDED